MGELALVVYYSMIHVLTPGHSKTLLLAGALSGKGRPVLMRYAAGFGLAHGLTMALAVAIGFVFKGALLQLAGDHPDLILKISLFVLSIACLYFFFESWRIYSKNLEEDVHQPDKGFLDNHPMITGGLAGAMPCPDVIGIGLVVPNMLRGMGEVVPTLLVVWGTVSAAIFLMGLVLTLLPVKSSVDRFHLPEWFPSGASAALCLLVIAYRVVWP
jgi:hypothetical protein